MSQSELYVIYESYTFGVRNKRQAPAKDCEDRFFFLLLLLLFFSLFVLMWINERSFTIFINLRVLQ